MTVKKVVVAGLHRVPSAFLMMTWLTNLVPKVSLLT
jgi:hypothetical protein